MKIAPIAIAVALLGGIACAVPAVAQGLPQGSYLRSCTGAHMEGDTLVARCRRADGREDRSALAEVRRCVGDIGNNNGVLQCSTGGGGQARGSVEQAPRYGEPRYGEPRYGEPRYGEPRYGAPAPGYGERRYGDYGERCRGLRREWEDLRSRLDAEWNPLERQRLEYRMREVRDQQERCRY